MRQILLQNATAVSLKNVSGFLLQNATILSQNETDITNCDDLITKSGSYYKMQRLLQIPTVHNSKTPISSNLFWHFLVEEKERSKFYYILSIKVLKS